MNKRASTNNQLLAFIIYTELGLKHQQQQIIYEIRTHERHSIRSQAFCMLTPFHVISRRGIYWKRLQISLMQDG